MTYRLFEAADYLRPYPAFADCDDHDTLRQWAVKKNNWQGPRARAVIVSDDGRFWYVSRDGVDEEVGAERKNSYSQVERLTLRLGVARTATTRGSPTFPHRNGGTTRRSM